MSSKFCLGPPPVLSEGEEQVSVKWVTNGSQTGFLRRSWVSSCQL